MDDERPLAEFLAEHPPDTDLTVLGWQTEGGTVAICELAASPWWDPAAVRAGAEGRLRVTMRGVASAEVALGWGAAEVEDLVVTADDPLLWSWGRHGTIFGNSPVPDPLGMYAGLADALDDLRYPGGAAAVLDDVRLSDWAARVSGRAPYHLLGGPEPVLDAVRPLLDAQGVEYVVLLGPEPTEAASALLLVAIGASWIICAEAAVRPSLAAA